MNTFFFLFRELLGAIRAKSALSFTLMGVLLFLFLATVGAFFLIGPSSESVSEESDSQPIEELRAYLADRLALNLINLKQVKPEGFVKTESGAVMMDDSTRKTVLTEYQKRKREEIIHPFLNEKVAIGLLPHVQAMLLARFLRGDLDGYPPFVFR